MARIAARRLGQSAAGHCWLYLALIAGAELLLASGHPIFALIVESVILAALAVYAAIAVDEAARRLALALTLAPAIRLLTLALPLAGFPPAVSYAAIAAPLLVAAAAIIRQLGLGPAELGLSARKPGLQLRIAGIGFGLGLIEYALLKPAALVTPLTWGVAAAPALALLVTAGFTEELIFRGLLQASAWPVFGRWTLVYVSLLAVVPRLSSGAPEETLYTTSLLFFAASLLFAHVVRWSGSILGVSLAHGLANVMLWLVLPNLTAAPADTRLAINAAAAVGCVMAAAALMPLARRA